ncbi:hypothetical protein FH972_010231 [Carpinus fangiana]|uniref:Uncharacterized protein n=1 Tax=Carpinus fangiana TaxID=176857 RepID=A0A660KTR7_9ROSI|nr:hypothetical protein FH972_010231 [Carpinus fangiana]
MTPIGESKPRIKPKDCGCSSRTTPIRESKPRIKPKDCGCSSRIPSCRKKIQNQTNSQGCEQFPSRRKNPIEQQELKNSPDLPISDRTCPSPKIGVCGARRACGRRFCPLQWGLRNLRRIHDSDLLVVSDQEASKSRKDRSL